MSLKDDIFACDDLLTEDVYVPQWKKTIRMKGLPADVYDKHESSLFEVKKGAPKLTMGNVRARFVVLCAHDPADDSLAFSKEDADRLGKKSSAAIAMLYEVGQRLSGGTKADQEELAKNLESIHGADSTSA